MHIGNIRFCKKVVNSFVIGTGLGFVTGGLVIFLKDKKVLNDIENYYLDEIAHYKKKAFSDRFKEEFDNMYNEGVKNLGCESNKENPLKQSDEIKRRITERLENREEAEELGLDLQFLDPEDQLDEDVSEAIRISEELHGGEPYTISREQFLGSCEDFVKTTIGYYVGDDTLVDDKGDIVDSEERDIWIGKGALNRFGEESGDEDTVYIRNPFIHTDFEVVRYFEEYDESEVR